MEVEHWQWFWGKSTSEMIRGHPKVSIQSCKNFNFTLPPYVSCIHGNLQVYPWWFWLEVRFLRWHLNRLIYCGLVKLESCGAHNPSLPFESAPATKIWDSTRSILLSRCICLLGYWVVLDFETADNQNLFRRFESSVSHKSSREFLTCLIVS